MTKTAASGNSTGEDRHDLQKFQFKGLKIAVILLIFNIKSHFLFRSGQRSHLNFSEDVGQGEEEDVLAYTVSQLSVSPENTIFHFLHLDVGEVECLAWFVFYHNMCVLFQGVFLAPLVPPSGPYHTQVLDNFRLIVIDHFLSF